MLVSSSAPASRAPSLQSARRVTLAACHLERRASDRRNERNPDIDHFYLADRRHLAEDGLVFVYERLADRVLDFFA